MKKTLRIKHCMLILLITISYNLNAQKLVKIDNQWNIVSYSIFSPNTYSHSVRIGEDTTINSINYNKLYYSHDSLNIDWNFNYRYLREDFTKKVYWKEYDAEEVLLYDFSLEMNDTFLIEDFCTLIVNEVDSVVLNNGEVRKRLKLGVKGAPSWGDEYWIDGIGSDFGLISHFRFCSTDYLEKFLCFYSNSELLYPEAPPSCFITPVKEIKQHTIKIFPNPFQDVLIIENKESHFNSFIIYNLSGKIVKNGLLANKKNIIDLQEIKSGFYVLKLIGKEGNLYSQKLIKN